MRALPLLLGLLTASIALAPLATPRPLLPVLATAPAAVFEPNLGQFDAEVLAVGWLPGETLFVTAAEGVRVAAVGEDLLVTREPWPAPVASVVGEQPLPGVRHYLRGADPAGWVPHVPTFAALRLDNGVVLGPVAVEPRTTSLPDLRLAYSSYLGAAGYDTTGGLVVDPLMGILVAGSTNGPNLFPKGLTGLLPGAAARPAGWDAFVSRYDPTGTVLLATTFLGGRGTESVNGFSVGSSAPGLAGLLPVLHLAGNTGSPDFPTTQGAAQRTNQGGIDAYVAILSPLGDQLLMGTLLGGLYTDALNDLAVDALGNSFVAGYSNYGGWPTTSGAFQRGYAGGWSDAWVAKVGPDGALAYSTYLGGRSNDMAHGVAVDAQGSAVVVGNTGFVVGYPNNFPLRRPLDGTTNGYDEAFIAKLTPDGRALEFSTFYGGTGFESGNEVALDAQGNAYVTGHTSSTDLTTVRPAQATSGGGSDAFVASLTPDGQALRFATYYGGASTDVAGRSAVAPDGSLVLMGKTASANLPTVRPLLDRHGGIEDYFVAKLAPDGSRFTFATYWGGNGWDLDPPYTPVTYGSNRGAVAVDALGSVYFAGTTSTTTLPMSLNAAQPRHGGGFMDAFVVKVLDLPPLPGMP